MGKCDGTIPQAVNKTPGFYCDVFAVDRVRLKGPPKNALVFRARRNVDVPSKLAQQRAPECRPLKNAPIFRAQRIADVPRELTWTEDA
jgi:hypothetical protein